MLEKGFLRVERQLERTSGRTSSKQFCIDEFLGFSDVHVVSHENTLLELRLIWHGHWCRICPIRLLWQTNPNNLDRNHIAHHFVLFMSEFVVNLQIWTIADKSLLACPIIFKSLILKIERIFTISVAAVWISKVWIRIKSHTTNKYTGPKAPSRLV